MSADRYDSDARDYDAVLVVSFGGPEGPDDVMPFLDNVLAGLRVPPPVKARIAQRYQRFGGVSPINTHTREFIAALERELAASEPGLSVYWGNRNWHPMLGDTLARMAADGVRRAIAYVTSTFSSYSGCRKYREDLYAAVEGLDGAPQIDKLRVGYNHPGFIAAMSDRLREAFARLPAGTAPPALLFTAHSLPLSMAERCDYQAQLREACTLSAEAVRRGKMGSRVSKPERILRRALARAGYQRGTQVGGLGRSCRRGGRPYRLRLRSYGGGPGSGRRSR